METPEITKLGEVGQVTRNVTNAGTGDTLFVTEPGGFSLDCCLSASG